MLDRAAGAADEILAGRPSQIVYQEFEYDRGGGFGQCDGPVVVGDVVEWNAFFPAKARAIAADIEGVAEANIDLGGDQG